MVDLNDFEVLCENKVMCHIVINKDKNTIDVTNYPDNPPLNPFVVLPVDMEYVDWF